MTKDLETNQKAEIQYQRESQLVASLRQEYNVLNQQFFTYKTNYPIESVNLAKVSQEDKATQTEDLVTIQQDNSTQTGDLPILFDQSVKSKYALLNSKFHGAMILNNMSQNAVERLQQEFDSVSATEFAENLFLNHHRVAATVAEMFTQSLNIAGTNPKIVKDSLETLSLSVSQNFLNILRVQGSKSKL
jgi:hypothetical protein